MSQKENTSKTPVADRFDDAWMTGMGLPCGDRGGLLIIRAVPPLVSLILRRTVTPQMWGLPVSRIDCWGVFTYKKQKLSLEVSSRLLQPPTEQLRGQHGFLEFPFTHGPPPQP